MKIPPPFPSHPMDRNTIRADDDDFQVIEDWT